MGAYGCKKNNAGVNLAEPQNKYNKTCGDNSVWDSGGERLQLHKLSVIFFLAMLVFFAGCGGGGGGTASNPVGPVSTGSVADLSGRVSFAGQPLSNAAVYLYSSEKALQAGVVGLASLRGSVLAQTQLTDGSYFTRSDSGGRYSFTGIPVGEYTLIAVKDETHQFAQTGVMLGSVTTADAQLTPTGKVSGRLELAGGLPVRGAIVHLVKTSYVAISDVNGDFVINHVPAGQNFTLGVVSTEGTLQTSPVINISPAEDRQLGILTLAVPVQQVSTINGSVSAVDSSVPTSALNGRIILVTSSDPNPLVALTDASGNFSLNVKSAGNFNVSAVGGEFAVSPTVQTVTVSALGATVSLPQSFVLSKPTVVLPPSTQFYTCSGTINKRSKAFNEPDNAGVALTLTSTDAAANVFSAVTSPTGSFTFSVPAGTYNLAAGGGYAFETAFANPLTINAPTTLNALIWLVPTEIFTSNFLVEGNLTKVTRINGETDDANVIVTLTPTTGAAVTFAGSTTSAGNFAVRVPAGTYNLAVTGDYKFETAFANPVTVSAATNVGSGIRLVPVQAPVVQHTVSGSVNKLDFVSGETDNGGVIITLTSIDASAKLYSTVTTSGGAFTFKVDPGTYTLAINSGYKFAAAFSNPVDASVGNVNLSTAINIMPLAAKMFILSGNINKVIKKAGESNNGDVNVTLRSDSATFKPQTTVTEANGSFLFKVPAGNYALEVGSGYVFVTPPSGFPYVITNADLIISPAIDVRPAGVVPASIGGSITPPRPNNQYRVRIEKTDGTYTDNETTAGDFYFNNLASGVYKIVVLPDANGYYIESALLNVAEGQNLTGVSLAPTAVAPFISTISATANVLTVIGNGFGTDVSSFSILVDGNQRARPVAFTLTDTQDQAMIVSVTPGQHNVVAEKIWKRPTTTETFVLKSAPVSFSKAMGSPVNVSVADITDISAGIFWTNADFTSKSRVVVSQVSNGSQAASIVLDGTSFQVNGLLASTNYAVNVYNRFGDVESTPTSVNFTTRSNIDYGIASITLQGSETFIGEQIFAFEVMNGITYVGRYQVGTSGIVYITAYDASGSAYGSVYSTPPMDTTISSPSFSLTAGGGFVYFTYKGDSGFNQLIRLNADLTVAEASIITDSQVFSDAHMVFAAGKLFVAARTPGDGFESQELSMYPGPATSLATDSAVVLASYNVSWFSSGSPVKLGFDDKNLYWARFNHDLLCLTVDRYPLTISGPQSPEVVAEIYLSSSAVEQFGVGRTGIYLKAFDGSSYNDYFINKATGYIRKEIGNERGIYASDDKGRVWMGEEGLVKGFIQLDDDEDKVEKTLKVYSFPNAPGASPATYPGPAEFLKTDSVTRSFSMLYQYSDGSNTYLNVFRYPESY